MKFTVRAAILDPSSSDSMNPYTEGEILGIVTAEIPYEGAIEACKKVFKSNENPSRKTGWGGVEGGLFFTSKRDKDGKRVDDKPFFLRIGR